ncbi:MAG: VWA domain-containing protein [Bacteroidales bacterium]|jgi:Ca-activated chloride channel family protein|nr:VWA domain-containing protein [Bacteroidales bacterium]MDD2569902.1 VWA domain-containing protein [Bacteroidales bacterium]MDD3385049.1 VWA domain-containing protein [Bacteroidales bacterium]MDD3811333.1 VWA domain-containing protein [Bacteroidales bacterium]MDD4811842.1 VWA domain-containing protein [Bacteroidales bacterium]
MNTPFRFANESYLLGLLVIPMLVALFFLIRYWSGKRLQAWSDHQLLSRLVPLRSSSRPVVKFMILMMALGAMIIALARPQYGSKLTEVKRKGIELMIALDVSNSMLAEDIQPSRLENAKMAISRLLDKLQNDKIGLIVFAGDAYVQMPITTDYAAAKLFLDAINPQMVPRQGTSVSSAIRLAMRSFTPESEKSRAIIIITDGEDHEEGAIDAAREAAEAGIVVHTIGIGTPSGVPIPISGGSGRVDFRTDAEGQVVISKLNEELLRQVSVSGKGLYIRATNARTGLNDILDEVNKMEKEEISAKVYAEYDEQFVYYAGLALLLLLIELIILGRKNLFISRLNLFESSKR